MKMISSNGALQGSQSGVFWGEIAPCEHLVQIYQDDDVFLDSLEGFVAGGLEAGDGVIVIATRAHLSALEDRLTRCGIGLAIARSQDQYIPLDAEETLAKFLVGGWPDEDLFDPLVTQLIARARGSERRVRAFGEMVAVMWAPGSQRRDGPAGAPLAQLLSTGGVLAFLRLPQKWFHPELGRVDPGNLRRAFEGTARVRIQRGRKNLPRRDKRCKFHAQILLDFLAEDGEAAVGGVEALGELGLRKNGKTRRARRGHGRRPHP